MPRNRRYAYLKVADMESVPQAGDKVHVFGFGQGTLLGYTGLFNYTDDNSSHMTAQMMHGQSGGPAVNDTGHVIGVNKGHTGCSPAKMAQWPEHTGNSVTAPLKTLRSFLNRKCIEVNGIWKIK